jgi:RNA polymerase sigma factor (sigma-70 family)
LEDSEQWGDGLVGLLEAAVSFLPGRGFKFSTFATRCISNEINSGAKKWLRLAIQNKPQLESYNDKLVADKKSNQLTDHIDLVDFVNEIRLAIEDNRVKINDDRTKYVIKRRLWDGALLREVGQELGLTRERTRQLECEGIKAIKKVFINPFTGNLEK